MTWNAIAGRERIRTSDWIWLPARRLAGLLAAALALTGLGAASASAQVGLQFTINRVSGPFVSGTEMQQNYDLDSGLSAALAVELAGVDPANLNATTALTASDGNGSAITLTESEVASGFGSPPLPAYFGYSQASQVTYIQLPSAASEVSPYDIPMPVGLIVSGSVLGVPTPGVVSPANPVLGQPVQLSDPGSVASDALTPGSPADTNGLMYSWNFGDGTATTLPSSSYVAPPHTYTAAGSYQVRVTVTDGAGNGGVSPQALAVQVSQDPQSISFPQLGPFTFGQAPVVLTASSSSGLPVSYSVSSGPCSVSGSTLALTGPGSCVVAADQAGDTTYAPASPVSSTIVVAPVPTPPVCSAQSVDVVNATATPISLGCGDAAGDSGDALSFAVVSGPSHGTLSALNAGTRAVTYAPSGTYSGPDSFTFDATDAQGTSTTATVSIIVAPQIRPANTGPPAIAGPPGISGTTALGHSLSCGAGVWSGTGPLSYAYQWKRDGTAIPGATGATYTIVAADAGHMLTCAVSATNPVASASALSAPVTISFASDAFTIVKLKGSKTGSVTIALDAPDAGRFAIVATVPAASATTKKKKAARAVSYGSATGAATRAGAISLAIGPTRQAKALLKKQKHLHVTLLITFTPAGGQPLARTTSLPVY